MSTLILGAHGPLGLACARQLLARGDMVIACVQAPKRLPPALDDLATEYPSRLTPLQWSASAPPSLSGITQALVTELPIPPEQQDEPADAAAALRAVQGDALAAATRDLLAPTLAAVQLLAAVGPKRALLHASWLGSIAGKVRGGDYSLSVPYAAHLMLVRSAALDLQRAGIAVVVGNAGRYRLDMAGPGFHADIDEVAAGLIRQLELATPDAEPTFVDWRGTARPW